MFIVGNWATSLVVEGTSDDDGNVGISDVDRIGSKLPAGALDVEGTPDVDGTLDDTPNVVGCSCGVNTIDNINLSIVHVYILQIQKYL